MKKSSIIHYIIISVAIFLQFSCTGPLRQERSENEEYTSDGYKIHGPFCPMTTISFETTDSARVEVVIYDIRGIAVDTIINDNLPAGTHEVDVDTTGIDSGIYFYKLKQIAIPSGDTTVVTKKMVLLK